MRARDLRRVLERQPLLYAVERQTGSHMRLVSAAGYPALTFAFHDNQSLAPGLVREILVKGVGLADQEARSLL